MKHIFALGVLIIVGAIGWQIGERLSSDAISMALGVLFGVLFGVFVSLPVALLFAASNRQAGKHADRVHQEELRWKKERFGDYPTRALPRSEEARIQRHERAQWVVVDGEDPPRIVG